MIQSIVGAALYVALMIDMWQLVTCNNLGIQQTHSTVNTVNLAKWLLDYIVTYPNSLITYRASNMSLSILSDLWYLSLPNARSRVGDIIS